MSILVLGLLLWCGAHLFKRLAPRAHASLHADHSRPLVAGLVGVSILLMIVGYRSASGDWLYTPPDWGQHANNLLLLVSLYLFGVGSTKGTTARWLRHPMLTGMILFGIGHLLVRGNLESVLLFGGLALWALVEIVLINRAVPKWTPPKTSPMGDVKALVGALVLMALAWAIHYWLGYDIFR